MEFTQKIGLTLYFLKVGDLTQESSQAIVNAANSGLLGGGGVDGAIHRRGGPYILEACKKIREAQGKCPAGKAVITGGGELSAKYVIHTVGPFWNGGSRGEAQTLASCYDQSLNLARKNKITTMSFPSISTGAYRYPLEQAAQIAQRSVIEHVSKDDHFVTVGFVLFSPEIYEVYRNCVEGFLP